MSKKDDVVRIQHMYDAAVEAVSFVKGKTRANLDDERLLSLSLVKLIEIIGEAAVHVSDDTRDKYPTIPWLAISGMRNRLIHSYFDVDYDRVWDTVTTDLPQLIAELNKILYTS